MRTKYSFYNLLISIFANILIPILGFLKVRLFINCYGQELNGLYIVLMQIITYVNICEASFSLAFRQLLYKPLAENKKEEVNRIFSGVQKIYNTVGIIVIIVGIISSLVVPFFLDYSINHLEVSFLFLILCLPFGFSYFLLPPSLVVIADQKEYKVSSWIQTISVLRMILMIVVIMLKLPYVLIYIIEGGQVLLANYVSNKVAYKNYPWLKYNKKEKKNEQFARNAKYTVVQNLSFTVINNVDSIIISQVMTLVEVSIYGSYNYLKETITKIVKVIIAAPMNSFGNLLNSNDSNDEKIFDEFYSLSTYLGTIIGVCVFVALQKFILFWLHDESYLLSTFASLIFAINLYYLTQREAVVVLRDVKGLFVQAKNNALLLAIVKILLSIFMVYKFGITGIFMATLLSYLFVDLPYNPKLLYRSAFNKKSRNYYYKFFIRTVLACFIGFISYYLYNNFFLIDNESSLYFVISLAILGIFVVLVTTLTYFILIPSFRDLTNRAIRLVKNKA